MNNQQSKSGIKRLGLVQLSVAVVMATISAVIYDIHTAVSVLLGGLVYIIPNAYFANQVFKFQGARAAKQIMNSFYKGEAMKIILSIFLFTAVFALCRIKPLAFFVSYTLVLLTHWLTPWIIVNKHNRQVK
ncbi:MAG: ATP synthase subunit I [Legionellales bacterium]